MPILPSSRGSMPYCSHGVPFDTDCPHCAQPFLVQGSLRAPATLDQDLQERLGRYGRFDGHAKISQALKRALETACAETGVVLADDQREALSMVMHKVARIINGDPNYSDNWKDIAGYATLVHDRLEGVGIYAEGNKP